MGYQQGHGAPPANPMGGGMSEKALAILGELVDQWGGLFLQVEGFGGLSILTLNVLNFLQTVEVQEEVFSLHRFPTGFIIVL